ncbi:DUF2946 domain-containing protein [Pseudomonas sp. JS3066]|uniref:DUF2946 domain-containing protein n=1 Tax=unclassified Pseudomonas TaxID=196821 RepID=UPI0012CE7C86|nr:MULTISPECIES: DUF2946 domain-containing protein [unclassified Pseudomonas]MDH4655894.1 DUF2946 domain-containing protein [Pseudomonas sp. BN606]MRK21482.1 DUF2946 domain-containing protein [Pseudomonas sp. JG-B]WVK93075.1 DUF2946 domain-containing protein [Pseudomonas sp. JS3066]
MTYGRARHRGAWLGLLAMLLVLVGPLVSQARDMGQGGVPAWMDELACATDHGAPGHEPSMPSHEMSWAKCGYCTLLLNSPALTQAGLHGLDLAGLANPQPALATLSGHGGRAIFPGALTRAPPVALS